MRGVRKPCVADGCEPFPNFPMGMKGWVGGGGGSVGATGM